MGLETTFRTKAAHASNAMSQRNAGRASVKRSTRCSNTELVTPPPFNIFEEERSEARGIGKSGGARAAKMQDRNGGCSRKHKGSGERHAKIRQSDACLSQKATTPNPDTLRTPSAHASKPSSKSCSAKSKCALHLTARWPN